MKNYSNIRGFNYQPSYAISIFESWRHFDASIWEKELRRGKEYFPGINTVRIWMDWNAYVCDPKGFIKNFITVVDLVDRVCRAKVVVCLMNRWHNSWLDAGGIYIDHFMPGWGWINSGKDNIFLPYLHDVVGAFKDDPRILVWDCCNEPFTYSPSTSCLKEVEEGEFQWLKSIYETIKDLGAVQDAGISIHPGQLRKGLERVEPIEDVLLIHPYSDENEDYKDEWTKLLDDYTAVSNASGKPLLITECCWGSTNDIARAEIISKELAEFSRRGIGFIAHAMCHSLLADLHGPEYGPVGAPGNLMFIGPDGNLRSGHGVFNQY